MKRQMIEGYVSGVAGERFFNSCAAPEVCLRTIATLLPECLSEADKPQLPSLNQKHQKHSSSTSERWQTIDAQIGMMSRGTPSSHYCSYSSLLYSQFVQKTYDQGFTESPDYMVSIVV